MSPENNLSDNYEQKQDIPISNIYISQEEDRVIVVIEYSEDITKRQRPIRFETDKVSKSDFDRFINVELDSTTMVDMVQKLVTEIDVIAREERVTFGDLIDSVRVYHNKITILPNQEYSYLELAGELKECFLPTKTE